MPYSLSMDLQQRPAQTLKQLQRMIMTRQMQQAIHLLQMPIMEVSPIVEMEMEQNPVLEYLEDETPENSQDIEAEEEKSLDEENAPEISLKFNERDFEILRRLDEDFRDHFSESEGNIKPTMQQEKLHAFLESSVSKDPSLFDHLMQQAHEVFQSRPELALCEALIGNLDEFGFLTTPLEEIAALQTCSIEELEKILAVIQTFHPTGVGGRNLRDSLLIQLRAQKKQNILAYAIVEKHFDDLLHNRIPNIKRGLHCTSKEIGEMIDHHIAKLDMHPAAQLSVQPTKYIIPDIKVREEGENLVVEVNDESTPRLHLNRKYLRMLDDESLSAETKEFIKQKIASAKWLIRNLIQRSSTLERIAQTLIKWQKKFLVSPEGRLVPMTMKGMADELELHESTIARAVANKYIDTPRGILPLRSFFTNALVTQRGEKISANTVRDMLKEIINNEDLRHPYSDEAISAMMKEKGIKCARRTVAKYRGLLNIGSAQQRRKF